MKDTTSWGGCWGHRLLVQAGLSLALTGLLASRAAGDLDTDTDGMPDPWELQYSGTTTGLVPTVDLDSDGANNLAEWTAMTDPTNAASVFAIKSIDRSVGGGTVVGWSSAVDRVYSVAWTTNMVVTFADLRTNLLATPPLNVCTDSASPAAVCAFYKLKVHWTGVFDVVTMQSCLTCHNVVQGARGAVVLDFTNKSHHVQGTLTTNDCLACHNTGSHMGGSVRLHNADSPATLYTLTGDPLTSSTEAAKLNPFCLACHDSNGAGGNPPFSDLQMPPVRDTNAWAASGHALASLSCFGDGQTFGCHATTHGSKKLHMLAPYDVAANTTNRTEEEEGLCFSCHDGSPAKSITNDFAKTVRHPVVDSDPKRAAGRSVECTDCHSTHAARTGSSVYSNTATASRNQIGNPNVGVVGWAVSYGALSNFQAPGSNDYTVVTNASYTYQLCFKCHSGKSWSFGTPPNGLSANGSQATPPETDVAQAFSPMNKSGHPIVTGLDNYSNSVVVNGKRGLPASNLLAPWNVNIGTQTMDCNDCHNTDAASPAAQGPHGSASQFMLRGANASGWPNVTLSNFSSSWCANCHTKGSNEGHASQHNAYQCYRCHIVIPHGGKLSRLIADHDTMPARYGYNGALTASYMKAFKKQAETAYIETDCQASCGGHSGGTANENW